MRRAEKRNKARELVLKAIERGMDGDPPSFDSPWTPATAAHVIEACANRMHPRDSAGSAYAAHVRAMCANISDPRTGLASDILSGGGSPARVCSMTHEQMASRETKEFRKAALERKTIEATRCDPDPSTVPDSEVECRRCHNKKIVFDKLQTRSGDEGMTTFLKCLICKRRWKM
jgi:transcription elongation factor S-II